MKFLDRIETKWRETEERLAMGPISNEVITLVGLGSTLLISVLFALWAPGRQGVGPALWSATLSAFFLLLIWRLVGQGLGYARSLLITLAVFVAISYIPAPIAPGFLLLDTAVLMVVFLRALRRTPGLKWGVWGFIGVVSIVVLAFIFETFSATIGDPLVAERVRQFTLNPDTIYHAAFATIIKNYQFVATGLHGLTHYNYHILSHFFYGRAANLTGIEIYEVYGFTNFIAFAPLLLTGWVRFMVELAPARRHGVMLAFALLLLGPISQIFGRQWNSFFVSESYIIAMILFSGALASLIPIVRGERRWGLWLTGWVYLPFLSLAKISLGLLFAVAAGGYLVFLSGYKWLERFTLLGPMFAAWLAGYVWARAIPVPRLEVKWAWGWYQRQVGDRLFLYFLVTVFLYFFVLAPLFATSRFRLGLKHETRSWWLMFAAIAGVGFLASHITIDSSGYYFVNVHTFVALPVFFLLFMSNDLRQSADVVTQALAKKYYRVLIALFLACGIYYVGRILPREAKIAVRERRAVIKNMSFENPYTAAFQTVRADPDPKLFVYIPKTEDRFWKNADDTYSRWIRQQCNKMPFNIPLLTGKPAIYGLPDPALDCYTFVRGYESYTPEEYASSAQPNHTDEHLCAITREKGFHGFYRITMAGGAQKRDCL